MRHFSTREVWREGMLQEHGKNAEGLTMKVGMTVLGSE